MIESSSVRRALSLVRDEISPTREDKARLRSRIVAPAALGAGASAHDALEGPAASGAAAETDSPAATGGARASGAALGRWAALQAAGSVGALAGLVLLGVGGGVGFWLGQEVEHERARSAAALEAPPLVPGVVDAPVPATPPVALEPITSPPSPAASDERTKSAPPRARAHRRPAASSIDDELALLRRVERALRNNDPALARALLGELDERFPDSRLGEERAAARRIADCRSGEPDAVARARDFVREHGASVYRQRIVLACALDKNPE